MQRPARTWPDGRPVGGENGYPPEFQAFTERCLARFVARRLMPLRSKAERQAEFQRWAHLPGVTRDSVWAAWKELHDESSGGN